MKPDIERIKSFLDCDDVFVAQLFDSFIEESTECLELIDIAYENKEWKKIRGAAHKILGSARIFECGQLCDTLETIEEDAEHEKNLDTMKDKIDQLKIQHKECVDSMNELKSEIL